MVNKLKQMRRDYINSKPIPKYYKILGMISKGNILDAGCGEGNLSKFLLEEKNYLKIEGCDLNYNCKFNHKNFNYFQMDLDKEFFPLIQFDVIIFADVLEHLKEPEKVLEQTSRYTNKFIISLPNLNFFVYRIYPKLENPPKGESQHLHHWKLDEFLNLLPKGFKVVKKEYCSDFPEFRWSNYLFPKSSFFNQTIILEVIK